jgi:hypothetical protein
VVCPVRKRHKSMANWRAAFTTKRFLARLLLTKRKYQLFCVRVDFL